MHKKYITFIQENGSEYILVVWNVTFWLPSVFPIFWAMKKNVHVRRICDLVCFNCQPHSASTEIYFSYIFFSIGFLWWSSVKIWLNLRDCACSFGLLIPQFVCKCKVEVIDWIFEDQMDCCNINERKRFTIKGQTFKYSIYLWNLQIFGKFPRAVYAAYG